MRVYISGPITSGDRGNKEKVAIAKKNFASVEETLLAKGFDPINPFKVVPNGENMSWEDCMRLNLKALCDCDGIYRMPGWEKSQGARLESRIAMELGIVTITATAGWVVPRD